MLEFNIDNMLEVIRKTRKWSNITPADIQSTKFLDALRNACMKDDIEEFWHTYNIWCEAASSHFDYVAGEMFNVVKAETIEEFIEKVNAI